MDSTGEVAVTFTTNCEPTFENLAKIVSQNNWMIAGIQEMETTFTKRMVRLETQVQELRQSLEEEVKLPDLNLKRKASYFSDE